MSGEHGGKGNTNAVKGLPSKAVLHIRINDDLKARIVQASYEEDRSISDWVVRAIMKQL